MQVQAYLNFDGRCEEALEFYRKTLGAEVLTMMRFKDNPQPAMNPPGSGEKVMHASMRIGDATVMAVLRQAHAIYSVAMRAALAEVEAIPRPEQATAKTIEALNKLSLPAGVDIKIKASTR